MPDSQTVCPACRGDSAREEGHDRKGVQVFRCRGCCRKSTALSSTTFPGYRRPPEAITLAVRWYLRFRLSYADVAELLAERGVCVDPSSVYRWVQKFTALYGRQRAPSAAGSALIGVRTRPTPKWPVGGPTCTVPSTSRGRSSMST